MKIHFGNVSSEREEPSQEEGLVRIQSPSSRLGYVLAGLVGLLFILMLCGWLIVVSVLTAQSGIEESGVEAPTPWGAVILALVLFIPTHELVHAMWLPRFGLSSGTVMVIWPKKFRFGVYYEGCLTRGRWLMMRLAPFLCLTAVPVGLLSLSNVIPASFALVVFLQLLFLLNGIGSGGDIVAAIWVLFQVPRKTQICFRGGKAYWRFS